MIANFWCRSTWDVSTVFDLLHEYINWLEKAKEFNERLSKCDWLFTFQSETVAKDLNRLHKSVQNYVTQRNQLCKYLDTEQILICFQDLQSILQKTSRASSYWTKYQQSCLNFFEKFRIERDSSLGSQLFESNAGIVQEVCDDLVSKSADLPAWVNYRFCLSQVIELNLSKFVNLAEFEMRSFGLNLLYRKSFYKSCLFDIKSQDPLLNKLDYKLINDLVSNFQLDKELLIR